MRMPIPNGRRLAAIGLALAAAVSPAVSALAPPGAPADLRPGWMDFGMGLFGGLALFLFGLDLLAKGLQRAAADDLRLLLGRLTRNRILGVLTGAVVTAILNSSTITTVLVVGFVTAGVMTLAQSLSVIMGANIGSTFTAQIIAFNVSRYALLLIAVGFALLFPKRSEKFRHAGSVLMGLGFLFFGMGTMGGAMAPLRNYAPFLDLMQHMESPVLGILVGAAFTALVQSSAATIGIAIVMAGEGLVTLPAGIALVMGANIGTCVTALLAAIGKPREAQRAALAHVLFNVAGVLLWIGFIDRLADLVVWISPSGVGVAEVPRQVANAHTIFNLANTVILIGFTAPFSRMLVRLLPDRPEPPGAPVRPRFLDDELIRTPSLALGCVRREIGHLGEIVEAMLGRIRPALLGGSREALSGIAGMDDSADRLHERILGYLGRIRRQPLSAAQDAEFVRLMSASDHLEGIGDLIATDLVELGKKLFDRSVVPSDETGRMLQELHEAVSGTVRMAVGAVTGEDARAAEGVLARKTDVNAMIDRIVERQADRLASGGSQRPMVFRVQMELVESHKRIYSLAKRIARAALVHETDERGGGDPDRRRSARSPDSARDRRPPRD